MMTSICRGVRSLLSVNTVTGPGVSLQINLSRRFAAPTNEMATRLVLEKESHQYNWERAFDEIQTKERNSDRFTRLSAIVAYRESNIELNRYHNVFAYDHSRALITHQNKEVYINANLVKCPEAGRDYILTQGPLPSTVDDFWLMVFQYSSSVIVMLCNCVENNRSKSWQYWPVEVGHTMVLGEVREGLELEDLHECGGHGTLHHQELAAHRPCQRAGEADQTISLPRLAGLQCTSKPENVPGVPP